MIDLELIAPSGRSVADAALVDTGADSSAFPAHWMKRLGILKKECRRRTFATAGGSAPQWRYPDRLTAVVLGHRIELDAVFVDAPVALLGRADFMEHFELTFDQRGRRLFVRPHR